MDPDAALAEIRTWMDGQRTKNLGPDEVDRLCYVIVSLDGWLSNGGFLPKPWADARGAEHWQHVLTSTNARAYKRGYEDGQFDKTDGSI